MDVFQMMQGTFERYAKNQIHSKIIIFAKGKTKNSYIKWKMARATKQRPKNFHQHLHGRTRATFPIYAVYKKSRMLEKQNEKKRSIQLNAFQMA